MTADGAAAIETLQAELARAKKQARISDAAALKAVEELRAELAAHRQSEERITKMAVELKDAVNHYELLEKDSQARAADLKKALEAAKETRSEMRGIREELREAGDITAGRPYLLWMKFGDPKYAPMDQLWSAADAYADLAKSAADATEFYKDRKDHKVERLFWSQFSAPTRPLPLNERMVAWAELHRLSGLAMRSVMDHLWPRGPRPNTYFGLVQQFLGAVWHIDVVKRSACIEAARMALARVKTYWAGVETTTIATQGPAEGQDPAEHYFEEVLEGARLIEAQCSKSAMFK